MTDHQLDDQLIQAARAIFPDATAIESVPGQPDLARVESLSGEWRVKRWRLDVAPERIRFVHDVLDAATNAGLTFTPRLHRTAEGPLLRLDDRLFDATSWIPGRPAGRYPAFPRPSAQSAHVPAALTQATHEELTARVAEVHEALAPVTGWREAPRVTLQGIDSAVRASWQTYREWLRPVAARTPHVQRWIRVSERALPAASQALSAAGTVESAGRQVVCHAGLWPARVILQRGGGEEHMTGLIDFSQATVAPPLLDLAQLVTRFGGWSDETAELVTSAYSRSAALDPLDRRLLPAVAALDLTAETGRLLAIVYTGRQVDAPPAPTALRAGAEALLVSLEAVTTTLVRLQGPGRPLRRAWVPGRRKSPPRKSPGRTGRPRKDRTP